MYVECFLLVRAENGRSHSQFCSSLMFFFFGRSQQCLCMVLGKCWENSVEANSRSHLLLLLESPSADRTGQVSGQKPGASFRPCCPSLWASHPLTGLFPGPARGSLARRVRWRGQGHGHTHSSPCSVPVDVTCAFGCRRESVSCPWCQGPGVRERAVSVHACQLSEGVQGPVLGAGT